MGIATPKEQEKNPSQEVVGQKITPKAETVTEQMRRNVTFRNNPPFLLIDCNLMVIT
jgi:hypothetical protein